MPSRLAYDEAILLAQARLRMSDPELREGEVVKAAQQTRVGAKPLPWGIEGGFAVVYKYRTKSGRLRALRCFRAAVQPDTQTRYTQLGPYFKQHLADITAEFRYFDPGIVVKEPPDPPKPYPIIDMEWVEGATLLSKVDELCRARNQAGLGALADCWLDVMRRLRLAQVAHGDLAAENVMVRPDGRLVLIDYDVVYIPAFAGMQVLVAGQEDYQHRQSDQRQYNEWMDEFPALVIYTALRVLQALPQLWDKHAQRNAQGKPVDTNLLFRHSDFVLPARSALFLELDQISDPTAKAAIQALKKACVQPLDQVRFQIANPLEEFERAIIADDDDQILSLWKPPLDQDPAARRHLARVELARKRIEVLSQLRTALKTGNIQQIATRYSALIQGTKGLAAEEQKRAELAARFLAALRVNDDEQMLAVWEDMQKFPQPGAFRFTPQEQALITQARERKTALATFHDALKHKHIQQIADSYTQLVQQHKSVTPDERKCWELAQAFLDAYRADEDDAILAAHSEIENFQYRDRFEFTPAEKARIELARQRRDALVKARLALKNRWVAQIAQTAVTILDGSRKLTADERKQLDLARRFMGACKAGDDEAIVALREEIRRSPYESFFRFSDADVQRIALAQQQIKVLEGFRHVLRTGTARQVANFAAAHLQGSASLKPEERQCLEAAQKFVAAYDKPDEEALVAASDAVRACFHRPGGLFTAEEVQRIELARRRKEALDIFRRVAFVQKSTKALELLHAYAAPVLDQATALTPKERQLIQDARAFKTMYQAVLKAIQANNDQRIVAEHKPALVKHFTDFTQEERERILAAQRAEQNRIAEAEARQALAQAYAQQKYRDVLLIAEKLQGMTKKPLNDVQVALAKRRFIATQDPQHLKAEIQGNDLIATWNWPTDDLIQHVAVVWSLDHWPQHPEKKDRDDFISLIERNVYKQQGKCQVSVGHVARVYVQVYAALKDVLQGQQEPIWYYSEGRNITARAEVRIPCKVIYRLTRRPGSSTNELHIETDNGAPLPELVVVRKAGDVPASDGDGEPVARIGSNGSSKFREVLPLHVWNWPPKSVVRVFAAHASDTAWLTLVPLPDVWLEVN